MASERVSTDPTRISILEAGHQLLIERGSSETVGVKLASACSRAGFTTGAAYAIWQSQSEYQKELAHYLVSTLEWAGPEAVADEIFEIVSRCPNMEVAVRSAAPLYLERFVDNERFYLALQFWAIGNPSAELAESIRTSYAAAEQAFARFFDALLEHYELEVREPWTISVATSAVIAATEGAALRTRFLPDDDNSTKDSYAESLVALLSHFTQPKRAEEDAP